MVKKDLRDLLGRVIIIIVMILLLIPRANASTTTVFLLGPIIYGETFMEFREQVNYAFMNEYFRNQIVDELVVVIASPGGSLNEALTIYDYLVSLRSKVKVHTVASSHCFSAGMIVLQAGCRRYATEYSLFMTHLPLVSMEEGFMRTEDLNDLKKALQREQKRCLKLFIKRSGKNKWILSPLFKDEPYFFNPHIALQYGFIDEIIYDPITPMSNWLPKKKPKSGYLLRGVPLNE